MVQIVRYHETPVGSYDELILLPGFFEVPKDAHGNERGKKKQTSRITRIYVDQKTTTYNGLCCPSSYTFLDFYACSLHIQDV